MNKLTKIVSILAYLPELNVNTDYSSSNTIMFEHNGFSYIYEELQDKIFLYKLTREYLPQYSIDVKDLDYVGDNWFEFTYIYFTKDREYCYMRSYEYDFDYDNFPDEEHLDLDSIFGEYNGPKFAFIKLEKHQLSNPRELIEMFDLHEHSIKEYVEKIGPYGATIEYPEEYEKAFDDFFASIEEHELEE